MNANLRIALMVALGGALGSAARFGVGTFVQARAGGDFPLGTMLINVAGSLLLGFLMRYSLDTAAVTPDMRFFLTTGVCGGFTTFSTFSYETVQLLERGDMTRAAAYVGGSVLLSVLAALFGVRLARVII